MERICAIGLAICLKTVSVGVSVVNLALPWHGESSSERGFSDDLKPERREQSEGKNQSRTADRTVERVNT